MSQPKDIYPTWQSVWINLINNSANCWVSRDYNGAWRNLKILREWLPQECYDETNNIYTEIKGKLEKIKGHGGTMGLVASRRKSNVEGYLREKTLDCSGIVRRSLEKNGWLNRESGAKPLYEKKGHLGTP